MDNLKGLSPKYYRNVNGTVIQYAAKTRTGEIRDFSVRQLRARALARREDAALWRTGIGSDSRHAPSWVAKLEAEAEAYEVLARIREGVAGC